jgi:hypothetical protein
VTVLRLGDFCCQADDRKVDLRRFRREELVLSTDEEPQLIFSPLGHSPVQPRLALVGITPGGQWKKFATDLPKYGVIEAARKAAFQGSRRTILELLEAHGLAKALRIDTSSEAAVFEGEDVLTTSLAKCCLQSTGGYKYSAPDLVATPRAQHCIHRRLLPEIESRLSTLTHIILFGQPSWDAICSRGTLDVSIKQRLEAVGLTILKLPHFAQNFQQREIYCLSPSDYAEYFRAKPANFKYGGAAVAMTSATRAEVMRLRSERAVSA